MYGPASFSMRVSRIFRRNLWFNMVERLARVQAAYCQLFSARGKNQKIDRTIYRGNEREKGEEGDWRASERENKKQLTVLTLLIVATDLSLHWRRKLLPSFLADKKEEKTVEPIIAHPTDQLHIRSSLPNRLSSRSTSPSAPRAHLGITVLPGISARNSRCTRVVASCY